MNVAGTAVELSHLLLVKLLGDSTPRGAERARIAITTQGTSVVCLVKTEPVRSNPVAIPCLRDRAVRDRRARNTIVPAIMRRHHATWLGRPPKNPLIGKKSGTGSAEGPPKDNATTKHAVTSRPSRRIAVAHNMRTSAAIV